MIRPEKIGLHPLVENHREKEKGATVTKKLYIKFSIPYLNLYIKIKIYRFCC